MIEALHGREHEADTIGACVAMYRVNVGRLQPTVNLEKRESRDDNDGVVHGEDEAQKKSIKISYCTDFKKNLNPYDSRAYRVGGVVYKYCQSRRFV